MNNKLKLDKILEEIEKIMIQYDKICINCEAYFKGNGHYCKICLREKKFEQLLK